MADLEVYIEAPDDEWTPCVDGLRFYCWPHRTNHEFGLKDVEKIVYALGASDWDGWNDAHIPSGEKDPQCLLEVLRGANDAEDYAEHVEQGIECRERSDG